MRIVTAALLFFLLPAISCQAKVFIVDDDGPADFNNIQAAINAGRVSVCDTDINDSSRIDSDETG